VSATGPTLTPKERRFCEEYLVDLCATKAARRAGYSSRTAAVQAYALIRRPRVQAHVAELMAARAHRTQLRADHVLEELARLGATPDDAVAIVGLAHRVPEDETVPAARLARIAALALAAGHLGALRKARRP
jgi:hypothetical protein